MGSAISMPFRANRGIRSCTTTHRTILSAHNSLGWTASTRAMASSGSSSHAAGIRLHH
jgi:hypothetical protein